jgi:short-subunit dehydrogenase
MSSITAFMPYPTISHYAASKAFLRMLGQSLWYEMRGSGVKVCTVFPSAVDTPFYKLDDKMRRRLLRFGLMQSPEYVAQKALKAVFAGRRRCLPGLLTKIIGMLCAAAPAWVLLPILKIPAVKRILARV